jgi:hypothetical protein
VSGGSLASRRHGAQWPSSSSGMPRRGRSTSRSRRGGSKSKSRSRSRSGSVTGSSVGAGSKVGCPRLTRPTLHAHTTPALALATLSQTREACVTPRVCIVVGATTHVHALVCPPHCTLQVDWPGDILTTTRPHVTPPRMKLELVRSPRGSKGDSGSGPGPARSLKSSGIAWGKGAPVNSLSSPGPLEPPGAFTTPLSHELGRFWGQLRD